MTGKPGKNPFKGLYSYEEADKDIFHGRESESAELFDLVTLNGLTVVFGKSGIGKTSLLNAGLFPLLRERNFLPVRLRLDYSASGLPLIDQVKQAIQTELKTHNIVEIEKGESEPTSSFNENETLWEYFHRVDHLDENGEPMTPVLVFDQFEELFTIGKHHVQRDSLLDELYWLVEDQVPPPVKERILTRRETIPYLRAQTMVRVVLGLREDYLPHLNALKRRIPSIHRVLYRILHLNGIRAKEVMDKSGVFQDERIKKDILQQFHPMDMDPGQLVLMEELEVEPALLSLLCYQVYEKGIKTLSDQDKDDILENFYDRVLGQLPSGKILAEWIETNLLTKGGFRNPYYLEQKHELREAIETAIKKRLLRPLDIGGKRYVEIIHDVLVSVIRERRNRRIEEKRRLEKRKSALMLYLMLISLISSILLYFAFYQKNRSDELYKEAVCFRLASDSYLTLPTDNVKAIRIAEAAYKISKSSPPAAVVRALSAAAYSTLKRPFCIAVFNHTRIKTAVFSPDGSKILTVSRDKTAKLWDLTGKLLADLQGHGYGITSAVFSPDGSKILTVSGDKTAKLWDLSGKLLADLQGHTLVVNSAVFSPDGSKILTASDDTTAKLWDLTGKLLADIRGHRSFVTSAVFSPNGRTILITSGDNTATLWDLKGKILAHLHEYDDNGGLTRPVFSPDSSKILMVFDGTVALWNLSGKRLAVLKAHTDVVKSAVFSPDSSKILTASYDRTAKLWDLTGKLLVDLKGHTGWVYSAVFSPDGSKILTASFDKTAKLWDLAGKLLIELKGHKEEVYSAVFSPDGSKILTAAADKTAKLWDMTGKLLVDLKGYKEAVYRAVFSPDGSKILTAAKDGTVKVRSMTGNSLMDLKGHTKWVSSAVFSPDGSKILTASADKTAKLWDMTGKLLVDLKCHYRSVTSAVFSPDGTKILTASYDGTARLWDLTGKLIIELKGHKDNVYSARFSPDGSKILTASEDKTAKLWDLTGNLLADLQGHTDGVCRAVFSPDGKRIVTASKDGSFIIWPTPESIMEWLKTAPIPKLTQEEKEKLGIDKFYID